MNIEKRKIEINGVQIVYEIHYKRVKNVTLKIQENNRIVVSANPYVPKEKVDAFVVEKIQWIIQKQKKMVEKINKLFVSVKSSNQLYYLGNTYTIVCIKSNQRFVCVEDHNLLVHFRKEEDIDTMIRQFLRNQCESIFTQVVQNMCTLLDAYRLEVPQLKIREMKTRWGSCIPSKHQITLNSRMIHYDIRFLEYVVLHELVHFMQPNHSKKFYYIIENYMPDYRQRIALVEK